MSANDLSPTLKYISRITNMAASLGICLQFGRNFTEFRNVPDKQPYRHPVAPIFDPQFSDISPDEGLWMTGHDSAGEIMHTQAIRLVDLEGRTFGDHLQTRLGDYRPHGNKLDVNRSKFLLTPSASAIAGRVFYHGELWIKGGPAGYRGGCLAAILMRMFLAKAVMLWEPDFIVGLMKPIVICKGMASRAGYMHIEQHSILWHQRNRPEPFEEWIVWMSNADAKFNLRVPPETFYDIFESEKVAA